MQGKCWSEVYHCELNERHVNQLDEDVLLDVLRTILGRADAPFPLLGEHCQQRVRAGLGTNASARTGTGTKARVLAGAWCASVRRAIHRERAL